MDEFFCMEDSADHLSIVSGEREAEVRRGPSLLPPLRHINLNLRDYLFIIRISTLQSLIYLLSTLSILTLRSLWEADLFISDLSVFYAAFEKIGT